jgi:hypothetical protein
VVEAEVVVVVLLTCQPLRRVEEVADLLEKLSQGSY